MHRARATLGIISCIFLTSILFQNCGDAFGVRRIADANFNSEAPTTDIPQTPVAAPKTRDPFFGIHYDILWETEQGANKAADIDAVIAHIKDLGVGSVRMPIRWLVIQDPGATCKLSELTTRTFNLPLYRNIIDKMPKDIEILAYLETPPPACRELFKTDPAAFAASYASYVKLAVDTYKDRIKEWEIWNEPNNNDFYMSPASGLDWSGSEFFLYVLKPAYDAIRAADPTAKIVSGSFVGNGVAGHDGPAQPKRDFSSATDPYYFIPNFLDKILDAAQTYVLAPENYFVNVSTHPYHQGFSRVYPYEQTYGAQGTSAVLKAQGINSNIYWTEFGTSVTRAGSEMAQAEELEKVMAEAIRARDLAEHPLKKAFWFSLRDYGTNDPDRYGLINKDTGVPRMSFDVYKRIIKANARLN